MRVWIVAHNAVVEEAWKSAESVLPMTFDVIVRGDAARSAEANLVGWLAEHHAALQSRLQALRGRAELGVQILWNAGKLTANEAAVAKDPGIPPRGRAYFAHHKLLREHREQLERSEEADFRRYCENLSVLADDVQINKSQALKGKRMVLNLSLLAAQAAIARVGAYLEEVSQEPGVEVRFTEPWPPYSFTGTFGNLKDSVRDQEDIA